MAEVARQMGRQLTDADRCRIDTGVRRAAYAIIQGKEQPRGLTGIDRHRLSAGSSLVTTHGHVDIERIEFDAVTNSAGPSGRQLDLSLSTFLPLSTQVRQLCSTFQLLSGFSSQQLFSRRAAGVSWCPISILNRTFGLRPQSPLAARLMIECAARHPFDAPRRLYKQIRISSSQSSG